jgi:hypothetical protein
MTADISSKATENFESMQGAVFYCGQGECFNRFFEKKTHMRTEMPPSSTEPILSNNKEPVSPRSAIHSNYLLLNSDQPQGENATYLRSVVEQLEKKLRNSERANRILSTENEVIKQANEELRTENQKQQNSITELEEKTEILQ